MEITRCGSQKFYRFSRILKGEPEIEWDSQAKGVRLKHSFVLHRDRTYDYHVFLTLGDIERIIQTLTDQGARDARVKIAKTFSTQPDKLLKVVMWSVKNIVREKEQARIREADGDFRL